MDGSTNDSDRSSFYLQRRAHVQILDSENSLNQYLTAQSGKSIKIVTAFAGGTEAVLGRLIGKKNKIDLLIGTINAFSSPKLIEYCRAHSTTRFRTYVDFRYHNSVHWKLYLVGPRTVVIGSANFTETGLSLQRDTCVVIDDRDLYIRYEKLFHALLTTPETLKADHTEAFEKHFGIYCNLHTKMQRSMARSKSSSSLQAWLEDETNQQIPLFIWESTHSDETKAEAKQLLRKAMARDETMPALRDFFTYDAEEGKLRFSQGDVVLCTSMRGGHIGFFVFDRIIYREGCYFIYSYRQKKYPAPFSVGPLRQKLKAIIPGLFQKDAEYIDRDVLSALVQEP